MDEQRPTPLVEDLDGTRRKLEAWFGERRGCEVHIPDLRIPDATGMSNVTLLFETRWQEHGETKSERCVGRLQPEIETPVFPIYDLASQYHIMAAVGANSDIPVPELRGLETDTSILGVPFYVMKHTDGRIPTDMPPYNMDGWMMHEIDEGQRASLWNAGVDTMAAFHKLDYASLGLDSIFAKNSGETPLATQLQYWTDYADWAFDGARIALCDEALTWLWNNQPQLPATRLCWGDSRLANMIFTEDCCSVAAVLDWEMAVTGDPLQDIAWWIYLDRTFAEGLSMPRLPGLPTYEDSLARWAQATGGDTQAFGYYTVFAALRYGLILARIMYGPAGKIETEGNFALEMLDVAMKETI